MQERFWKGLTLEIECYLTYHLNANSRDSQEWEILLVLITRIDYGGELNLNSGNMDFSILLLMNQEKKL